MKKQKTSICPNSPSKKDIWTQSANICSGDKHGKFDLRDYYWFFFGVFTLSGRTMQVETIQTSSWDSVKGDHDRLITVAHKEVKIKILEEKQFRNKFRNFDQYGAP